MTQKKDLLADGVVCKDPLTSTVSIAISATEKETWIILSQDLKEINPKASIAEFGRKYLREMMLDLRKTIDSVKTR